MKLSIVIVNYNVKYFLEQCLRSVEKAKKNIDAEVFVVDNNSVDGSCNMVKDKFPWVYLIENDKNLGFSKANNQAIKLSKGEYILILNPDTLVEEDTLEKCLNFMDSNPLAGALSVKMIDGKGNFLPESKRGLPTPIVAFYKIFGISSIFPKSKIFNKYHLGYLDKNQIQEIEILPGAYMLIRRKALDKTGLFDESFFMYGEDIDLSYRIIKSGFKNYYFPDTTIIHYKGESTKKGSLNYVRVFYNAMIIFAKKHFSKNNARIFSIIINLAIYFRAFISILKRFTKSILLPCIDAAVIYLGFFFFEPVWASIKFGKFAQYPSTYLTIVVPTYIIIWLISVFYSGGYDKPIKIINLLKGVTIGTIIILIIYSLLPEHFRFSRALLIIGTVWTFISTILIRLIFHILKSDWIKLDFNKRKRIAIAANEKEYNRIKKIIEKSEIKPELIGFISNIEKTVSPEHLGNINQIKEIISINKIGEIVFSGTDLSSQQIIKSMLDLTRYNIDFKIAPPESLSVIGSNSINTPGDLYLVDINSITKIINQRNKRMFDFFSALLILVISPFIFFLFKYPSNLYKNIFKVVLGYYSWVGYYPLDKNNIQNLPSIKPGILTPVDKFNKELINTEILSKLNFTYAKDYKILNDLEIIFKGFKYLDRLIKT